MGAHRGLGAHVAGRRLGQRRGLQQRGHREVQVVPAQGPGPIRRLCHVRRRLGLLGHGGRGCHKVPEGGVEVVAAHGAGPEGRRLREVLGLGARARHLRGGADARQLQAGGAQDLLEGVAAGGPGPEHGLGLSRGVAAAGRGHDVRRARLVPGGVGLRPEVIGVHIAGRRRVQEGIADDHGGREVTFAAASELRGRRRHTLGHPGARRGGGMGRVVHVLALQGQLHALAFTCFRHSRDIALGLVGAEDPTHIEEPRQHPGRQWAPGCGAARKVRRGLYD
mmetsp:Transcript_166327/g.534192  ORF Transcript_166327/g.534192 Transcript_166327/m.534192 type:complete len:279 (+) Transcript_166327:798-1634(+)